MVRFEQRDLRGDMTALGKFDLILCRNVLIYFDSATKKSICATLQSVLNPGAFLSLGAGEILPSGVNLRRVAIGGSSFYCPAAS
jgi:chemotaxis protein methyltransferase CheR